MSSKPKRFKYSVFSEDLYDPQIHSILYQKDYISKCLAEQGETNALRHDLLIAWYEDFNEVIPYSAVTVFEAKIRWLKVRIYGFIFQNRVINEIIKELKVSKDGTFH